jgi:hypothetical protein
MNAQNLARSDDPQSDPPLFPAPATVSRPEMGYQSNDALAVNSKGGAGSVDRFDANAGKAKGNPFGRLPLTVPGPGH